MECVNGKPNLAKKDLNSNGNKLEYVSLREVPLDVRRREAKKPLFLTRYE